MGLVKKYGMAVSVIAVCFLVVVYVTFNTYSIFRVSSQINYVVEHPYKVMSEINKIRSRVLETNIYLPLFIADSENSSDSINGVLQQSWQENAKSLEILKNKYLGKPEDLVELEGALEALKQGLVQTTEKFKQNKSDSEAVRKHFAKEIEPLTADVEVAVQKVIASADKRVLLISEETEKRAETASVYAVMIGILMIFFVAYIYKLRNQYLVNAELKKQQLVLQDALLSAKRANDAKRDFLSRMSHEIRTPMNAIIGMAAIAFNYIDDKNRISDCLSKITFSSKHLLMLINDVLDMSKIEDGKLNINQEIFDLKKMITALTDINYSLAKAKNQSFEVVISGFEEEMLVGDSLRVNQVLINLLSNAIKFTPKKGSIRLEVKKLRVERDQIWLRFIIKDNGIGMKQEFLEHLYEPFEQENSNIAKKFGGTGLGMSITKNLITIMNGSISVQSQEGEGTVFTVDLPFGLTEQPNVLPTGLEEISVLVVDDDNVSCEHASILLGKMGVAVEWVLNGFEAIEKVRLARENDGKGYDVCFIDWCMPEIDGLETARRIRNYVGADALIIIISAYDWSDIEEQAKAAGVDAFIAKPFFASTLYNTLLAVSHKDSITVEDSKNKKSNYDFKGKKILLAEDNELNMEIAVELLKFVNAQVVSAENGKIALEIFEESQAGEFDLILMDIQMPQMNGYEAARKIRASQHPDGKAIPIIAMTADAFRDDIHAALAAGMNEHLAKPIDVEVLYAAIARFVKV